MAFKSTCPTLAKVSEDEPIFVLRAQDESAPDVIEFWIRENPQIPDQRVAHARQCIEAMRAWPHRKPAD